MSVSARGVFNSWGANSAGGRRVQPGPGLQRTPSVKVAFLVRRCAQREEDARPAALGGRAAAQQARRAHRRLAQQHQGLPVGRTGVGTELLARA